LNGRTLQEGAPICIKAEVLAIKVAVAVLYPTRCANLRYYDEQGNPPETASWPSGFEEALPGVSQIAAVQPVAPGRPVRAGANGYFAREKKEQGHE